MTKFKKEPAFSMPYRQVHLDFHTGPAIGDVGVDFDPRAFAKAMKQAHVNSVTVFAKCHHGHLYYNTRHEARHPGLKKNLDLLAGQVEALHREGIRAPIYMSVQCDEFAANTHPEWIAKNPDGSHVGAKPLDAGWQILDMSSPYQDYLYEQTAEVLKLFHPVDGLFFDMCWDQPSVSPWALAGMVKENLNPASEADRARYATMVSLRYMKRYFDQVKAASGAAGVFFNSRPFANLAREVQYQTQAEIEALPTGGWGYMYFPMNVRFVRNFGVPYLGMTARFHKSWADFGGLKPYAALEYETAQMIAHGARCSIGDQLHPRGVLDPAAYDLIGKAYQRVEAREPWLVNTAPVSQIGLLQVVRESTSVLETASRSNEGATRMLTQLRHQFDLIDGASDFSPYDLLILPDVPFEDAGLLKKIKQYMRAGGKILATGHAGLNAAGTKVLLSELGIAASGPAPFQNVYFRPDKKFESSLAPSDHVLYDRSLRVTAGRGTVLARVVEPYFDRTWRHFSSHAQTPGATLSRFAAAVATARTAYIAFPVFHSYATHGNLPYRDLVAGLLQRLLPRPLLTVSGPSYLEATLTRQTRPLRTIVHLLAYSAQRRTMQLDILEDIVPLTDLAVSLRTLGRPLRVYMAPEMTNLPFEYNQGVTRVRVPQIMGHAMLVLEGCHPG
jgi:hypothetical protein